MGDSIPKSKKIRKGSSSGAPLSMEEMIKKALKHQQRFRAELKGLKAATAEDSVDDFTLTLLHPNGSNEQLINAIGEVKGTIASCGESWRRAIHKIAQATLIINSLLSGPWKNFTILQLSESLAKVSNLCAGFKGDEEAMWICITIHRLQLQLLHYISYEVMRGAKLPGAGKDLSIVLESLYSSTELTGLVSGVLVQEAAKNLSAMLVDHAKNFGMAAVDIIMGGAKSVMMMKVDAQLLTGLQRGVVAGFELFKHCTAAEQFKVIQLLDPMRELVQPLISYEQLLQASRTMEATNGNWLLTATYTNNLMKVAYCALRSVGSPTTSAEDNDLCLKLLQACVVGDGAVMSLSGLLKSVRRKRRSPALNILGNAMLNGEALTGVLRSIVMEAMGELMESVENFAVEKLDVIKSLASTALKGIEAARASAAASAGAVANGAAVAAGAVSAAEKAVLQTMAQLLTALQEVLKWTHLFEKSIAKVVLHVKGLLVSIDALLRYWDMFQGKLQDSHLQAVVLALYEEKGLGEKLSFTAIIQKLSDGVSISTQGHNNPSSTDIDKEPPSVEVVSVTEAPEQLKVLVQLGRKHLTSNVAALEKMHGSFKPITVLASTVDDLQKDVEQETQRQLAVEHPTKDSMLSFKWLTGGGGGGKKGDSKAGGGKGSAEALSEPAFLDKAHSLMQMVESTLCKAVADVFAENSKGLGHQTDVFQFFLEAVSQVEDMFFDLSEFKDLLAAQGQLLRKDAEKAVKHIESLVTAQLGRLKDIVLGGVLSGGWWNTVSDAWGTCGASAGAMGMLREGVQLLIGPGACPEKVEEASMVAILELDALTTMVVQTRTSETLTQAQADQLLSVHTRLTLHIAQAKATSTQVNVQALLGQNKYRAKVTDVLRKSWQAIEEGVMQEHTANMVAQEALSSAVVNDSQLGNRIGSCDAVPQLIKANKFQRGVEYTEQAARELLQGQGGISGLAPGLLRTLRGFKRSLQKSEERTLAVIIAVERGDWRPGYPFGYCPATGSDLGSLAPLLADVMPDGEERDGLLEVVDRAQASVQSSVYCLNTRLDIIGRAIVYLTNNEPHLWSGSSQEGTNANQGGNEAFIAAVQMVLSRITECENQLSLINQLKIECNGACRDAADLSSSRITSRQLLSERLDALLIDTQRVPNPLCVVCTVPQQDEEPRSPSGPLPDPDELEGPDEPDEVEPPEGPNEAEEFEEQTEEQPQDEPEQQAEEPMKEQEPEEQPQAPEDFAEQEEIAQLFVCEFPECGIEFSQEQVREAHQADECLYRTVLCELCGDSMQWHLLAHHQAELCSNSQVVCPHCDASMPPSELPYHADECPRAQVQCDVCGESVKRGELSDHMNDRHSNHECPHCAASMPQSRLAKHLNECPEVPVSCALCSTKFIRSEQADHAKRCPKRQVKCNECGEKMNHDQLSEHMETVHGPVQCSKCDQWFPQAEIKPHTKRCTARQQVQCAECSAMLYAEEFATHMKDVHGPVQCSQCHKWIPQADLSHHSSVCSPRVMVKCKECGMSLDRTDLRHHMDTVHAPASREDKVADKIQEMLDKKIAEGQARKAKYDKPESSAAPPRPPKKDKSPLTPEQIEQERQKRAEEKEAAERKAREDRIKAAEKKKLAEERKIAEAERKQKEEERWREENAAVLAKLRAEKEALRVQQKIIEQRKLAEAAKREEEEERRRAENLAILAKLRAEKEVAEREQRIAEETERKEKEALERRRREKIKEDLVRMKAERARQEQEDAEKRAAAALRAAERALMKEQRKKEKEAELLEEFVERMTEKRERPNSSRKKVITQAPVKRSKKKIPSNKLFRFQLAEKRLREERKRVDEQEKEELTALRNSILMSHDAGDIENAVRTFNDKREAYLRRKESEREADKPWRSTFELLNSRSRSDTDEPTPLRSSEDHPALKPLVDDDVLMNHLEQCAISVFLQLKAAHEQDVRKRPLSALRAYYRVLGEGRSRKDLQSPHPSMQQDSLLGMNSSLSPRSTYGTSVVDIADGSLGEGSVGVMRVGSVSGSRGGSAVYVQRPGAPKPSSAAASPRQKVLLSSSAGANGYKLDPRLNTPYDLNNSLGIFGPSWRSGSP